MVAVFVPFNTSHAEDPIVNADKSASPLLEWFQTKAAQ